jgi:hypothetical protein
MRSRCTVLFVAAWVLTGFAGLDNSPAFAGDEVDYSAPYVTLENGQLVTKYPAKEHDPNAQVTTASGAEPSGLNAPGTSSAPGAEPKKLWVIAAAGIGLILGLLLLIKRRQRRA